MRILIDAASAAVTVSLTDCIRFCALPTSISVASMSSSVAATEKKNIFMKGNCCADGQTIMLLPCDPSMVAFTVERIFSCVAIVGILSQTWSKLCKRTISFWSSVYSLPQLHFLTILMRLSVHSFASSLAILVTSSEASAMDFAQEMSSLLLLASLPTSCDSLAMRRAILLAAAMMSLSLLDHCLTSWCRSWAASCGSSGNQ